MGLAAVVVGSFLLPQKLMIFKPRGIRDRPFSQNKIEGQPLYYTLSEARNVDLYSGMYTIESVFLVEKRKNVR